MVYLCLAVAVARLPGKRGRAETVVATAIGAAALLGYGALDIWAASDIRPRPMIEAVPAVLAALAAFGAAVVAARRGGNGAMFVSLGMLLLAVPALRGAADAVDLASTVAMLDGYRRGGVFDLGVSYGRPVLTAPFAFPAFFAGLRLVAVAMVTAGVVRRRGPPDRSALRVSSES